MIETKLLELRDRGTFIPGIAIRLRTNNESEEYLVRRAGYGNDYSTILVSRLEHLNADACYHPCWDEVIKYLTNHWFEFHSGDVIDVEYLRGETKEPKKSERFD